jgi:hypothetical protein
MILDSRSTCHPSRPDARRIPVSHAAGSPGHQTPSPPFRGSRFDRAPTDLSVFAWACRRGSGARLATRRRRRPPRASPAHPSRTWQWFGELHLLGPHGLLYLPVRFGGSLVVLAWVRQRQPPVLAFTRTALILAGLLSLAGYALFPTAPPRMVGLRDTLSQLNHIGAAVVPVAAVFAALLNSTATACWGRLGGAVSSPSRPEHRPQLGSRHVRLRRPRLDLHRGRELQQRDRSQGHGRRRNLCA